MKECPDCRKQYPVGRLICLDCFEILEEKVFLRFVWVTLALAVALQLAFQHLGVRGTGFLPEVFMNEAFLLVLSYPTWKLIQKLRDTRRQVLQEIGSLYSDRTGRLVLLGLLVFVIYLSPKILPALLLGTVMVDPADPVWYSMFWTVRAALLLAISIIPIAAIVDQGLTFFDPREPNTYLKREIEKVQAGAANVIHHDGPKKDFEPGIGDDSLIEAVTEYMEQHVGAVDRVFHELLSDQVHIDIHHIAPSEERPLHVLFTTGMSSKPMRPPEEAAGCEYAELIVLLPPWWPIGEQELEDEESYWPIRQMKALARLPHSYDTWLWFGHTVPNGDPPQPYCESTGLCCMMLNLPVVLGEDFGTLVLADGRKVELFTLCPLHADEVELKLEHGTEELLSRLYQEYVPDIIEADRPSVVKKGSP
jgi:hypothetical protein